MPKVGRLSNLPLLAPFAHHPVQLVEARRFAPLISSSWSVHYDRLGLELRHSLVAERQDSSFVHEPIEVEGDRVFLVAAAGEPSQGYQEKNLHLPKSKSKYRECEAGRETFPHCEGQYSAGASDVQGIGHVEKRHHYALRNHLR